MIDGTLRLFGIHPDAYRVLVRTFWVMSLRQPTTLVAQNVGRTEGAAWKAWLLYGFFGLMVAFLAFLGMPRALYATIVCSSAMMLIGMAVVADFSVFVLAPGDDEVLFHRPIRARTYLGARLTVAGLHVTILACCYGFLPMLTSLRWGNVLYPLLLLLAIVATALFAMLIAFAVYRAGLRMLGTQRLEALLTVWPALFSIMTFVIPQMMIGSLRGGAAERIAPFLDFLPPAWFAAIPEAILGAHDAGTLRRAALGLLVLPVGYWILVAAMGRGFLDDLLAMVGSKDVGRQAAGSAAAHITGHRRARRSPEHAAGYLLYAGALRSRDARMRTAPVLLMPVAFLLLAVFRPQSGMARGPFPVYLLGAGAGTLVLATAFHDHYRAAWLYGAAPLRHYGQFLGGVVHSMLVRHVLPVFVILLGVAVAFDPSWRTVASAVQGMLGGLLSVPFLVGFHKHPPFSREFQQSEQTAQMGIYFLSMLLVAFAGGVHALILWLAPWAFAITIPATGALLWLWLAGALRRHDARPPVPIRAPAA